MKARSPLLTVRSRVRSGGAPSLRMMRMWARAALGRGVHGEIALLLVGPTASRSLNRRYRHRDHATSVLSFPATGEARRAGLLGDLVVCPAVLKAEARAQGKTLTAHWAHLLVHGVLHLMGFDHVKPPDARRMERREIRILRRLGFADPYRVR